MLLHSTQYCVLPFRLTCPPAARLSLSGLLKAFMKLTRWPIGGIISARTFSMSMSDSRHDTKVASSILLPVNKIIAFLTFSLTLDTYLGPLQGENVRFVTKFYLGMLLGKPEQISVNLELPQLGRTWLCSRNSYYAVRIKINFQAATLLDLLGLPYV